MPYTQLLGSLAPTYHKLVHGTLAPWPIPKTMNTSGQTRLPCATPTQVLGSGGLTSGLLLHYYLIADPPGSEPPQQASAHAGLPTFTRVGAASTGLELLAAAAPSTVSAGDCPTIYVKPGNGGPAQYQAQHSISGRLPHYLWSTVSGPARYQAQHSISGRLPHYLCEAR